VGGERHQARHVPRQEEQQEIDGGKVHELVEHGVGRERRQGGKEE
jgi:hypothetical protein